VPLPADGPFQMDGGPRARGRGRLLLSDTFTAPRPPATTMGTTAAPQGHALHADRLSRSRGDAHVYQLIYETYEKAVGDEFGKTVLGFRGDETDYRASTPWTPKLLETFQAVKGYDFKPYIPLIFGGRRRLRRNAQGRLLGRLERHVPRQFLQAAARLVQRAEHGIHGPPEP